MISLEQRRTKNWGPAIAEAAVDTGTHALTEPDITIRSQQNG